MCTTCCPRSASRPQPVSDPHAHAAIDWCQHWLFASVHGMVSQDVKDIKPPPPPGPAHGWGQVKWLGGVLIPLWADVWLPTPERLVCGTWMTVGTERNSGPAPLAGDGGVPGGRPSRAGRRVPQRLQGPEGVLPHDPARGPAAPIPPPSICHLRKDFPPIGPLMLNSDPEMPV